MRQSLRRSFERRVRRSSRRSCRKIREKCRGGGGGIEERSSQGVEVRWKRDLAPFARGVYPHSRIRRSEIHHLSPRPLGVSNFFRSLSSTFLLRLILSPPLSLSPNNRISKRGENIKSDENIGWIFILDPKVRKRVPSLGVVALFLAEAYLVSQLGNAF